MFLYNVTIFGLVCFGLVYLFNGASNHYGLFNAEFDSFLNV